MKVHIILKKYGMVIRQRVGKGPDDKLFGKGPGEGKGPGDPDDKAKSKHNHYMGHTLPTGSKKKG